MEKRIKIFSRESPEFMADEINDFLKSEDGRLHDVIFQAAFSGSKEWFYAILIYTPEEETHEKKEYRPEENKNCYDRIQEQKVAFGQQRGASR